MAGPSLDDLLARATPSPVLMDGGMGTTVEDRGIPATSALWGSLAVLTPEGRAINDRVHAEFAAAGADILIANTHNASLGACVAYLEETVADPILRRSDAGTPLNLLRTVNRRAVDSARAAAGDDRLVAAGVGSAEGAYAKASRLSPAEVEERLEPQTAVLEDLGVDLVLYETLTTATEIEGVAALARRRRLAAWGAGLTCGADGRTLAGVTMEDAWSVLAEARPSSVFVQCTRFDILGPALEALVGAAGTACVVGVYANDGRTWEGRCWHGDRTSPEAYAAEALRWRDAGARIVGGCCGTGPEHVAALRRRLTGAA